jgi:hypothetical protein
MSQQVVSGIGQIKPLTSGVFGSTIRAFNRLSEEQRSRTLGLHHPLRRYGPAPGKKRPRSENS